MQCWAMVNAKGFISEEVKWHPKWAGGGGGGGGDACSSLHGNITAIISNIALACALPNRLTRTN